MLREGLRQSGDYHRLVILEKTITRHFSVDARVIFRWICQVIWNAGGTTAMLPVLCTTQAGACAPLSSSTSTYIRSSRMHNTRMKGQLFINERHEIPTLCSYHCSSQERRLVRCMGKVCLQRTHVIGGPLNFQPEPLPFETGPSSPWTRQGARS